MVEFKLKDPMIVSSRIKGLNGRIRELNTILDFNWHYSYLMKMDALELGYSSASYRPQEYTSVKPHEVSTVMGMRGIELCTLIKLNEVSIGDVKATDVEAIVYHIETPTILPVDVILGQNFLKKFKVTIDSASGNLFLT